MRTRYIEVLFHTFHYLRGEEYRLFYRELRFVEVRFNYRGSAAYMYLRNYSSVSVLERNSKSNVNTNLSLYLALFLVKYKLVLFL